MGWGGGGNPGELGKNSRWDGVGGARGRQRWGNPGGNKTMQSIAKQHQHLAKKTKQGQTKQNKPKHNKTKPGTTNK